MNKVRRVLQLGLWSYRDPVVLLRAVGVGLVLLTVNVVVSYSSPALNGAVAGVVATTSQSLALRRRIQERRYSVEPPPNSRPAEALARHRATSGN